MPSQMPKSQAKKRASRQQDIVKRARVEAAESGLLPHEWLLKVMRGEGIPQKFWEIKRDKNGAEINRELKETVVYPMFGERMDAAKAAAPFFAARLATQIIAVPNPGAGGSEFAGFDLAGLNERELNTVKKVLMDAAVRGMKGGSKEE